MLAVIIFAVMIFVIGQYLESDNRNKPGDPYSDPSAKAPKAVREGKIAREPVLGEGVSRTRSGRIEDFISDMEHAAEIRNIDFEDLHWKNDYQRARAMARSLSSYQRVRQVVFNRDGRKCLRCGSKAQLEMDHIVPVICRPDLIEDQENLQTLCRACNKSKSTDFVTYREASQ